MPAEPRREQLLYCSGVDLAVGVPRIFQFDAMFPRFFLNDDDASKAERSHIALPRSRRRVRGVCTRYSDGAVREEYLEVARHWTRLAKSYEYNLTLQRFLMDTYKKGWPLPQPTEYDDK